jgi:LacI family transcriptional regulator
MATAQEARAVTHETTTAGLPGSGAALPESAVGTGEGAAWAGILVPPRGGPPIKGGLGNVTDPAQPKSGHRSGVRDVAKAAGVSPSTVSNVLNNPHRVTWETRRRVAAAMANVGFVRNRAARQLRGAPSTVVGCIVLDIANPFYAELARGIEDGLRAADCALVLFSTDVVQAREARHMRVLEEFGARGVIADPVSWPASPLLELPARGTPVTLVNCRRGPAPVCAAAVDNALGGRLAAGQLLRAGHRRLAFVCGHRDVPSTAERAEGARQEVRDWGLDPRSALAEIRSPPGPQALDAVDQAVGELLALDPCPTAVLCFNDMAALGVLRGLRRRGIAVPERISVVGYDDLPFTGQLCPPLTTVHQPAYQLGHAAASLVLAEAEPAHQHREVLLRPHLVARQSVAAPPGPGR